MSKTARRINWPLVMVVVVVLLCLAAEWLDRQRYASQQQQQLRHLINESGTALQQRMRSIELLAEPVAVAIQQNPHRPETLLRDLVAEAVAQEPLLLNMTLSEQLTVTLIEPMRDQEAVLGMQYNLRPEWMPGVRLALEAEGSVWTGPRTLVQTGKPGVVSRRAVYADEERQQLLGLVSSAVDLQMLLASAGFETLPDGIEVAFRGRDATGELGEVFYGTPLVFQRSDVLQNITLSEGSWQLAARLKYGEFYPPARSLLWRLSGLLIALAVLLLWMGRERRTRGGQLPLQRQLMIMLLLLLMPMLLLEGWMNWRMAQRSTNELQAQLVNEVSARVMDRIAAFFDVSRRVVSFNVDQFRHGALSVEDSAALSQSFTLQIRQQPLLTFLSIGTHEGNYMAASRPPLGVDRGLRQLQSDSAGGRRMHMYRVDDANRRSSLIGIGNSHFDARTRPWFLAGQLSVGPHWYAPYRYAIDDPDGVYSAMGMGMAAPLRDTEGRFVGVITADMALIELSRLLKDVIGSSGGMAVLAEQNGLLLASSQPDRLYELADSGFKRIRGQDSDNPLLAAMLRAVEQAGGGAGRKALQVDGDKHLLAWHTHALPDGPPLLVAVSLPRNRLDGNPALVQAADMLLMMLGLLMVSLLVASVTSRRIAEPLAMISQWASELGKGNWQRPSVPQSRLLEVRKMSDALQQMTVTLESHTESLQQQVASRTEELRRANRELARQSGTDGLTGLANRRLFDSTLKDEWARAQREQRPLGLLMLDIDHFKLYNDSYGHLSGDECLRQVAEIMAQHARRPGDLAARYGGEEFALIVPGLREQELHSLAEQLRQSVQMANIEHAATERGMLTVSIGCSSIIPSRDAGPLELIRHADEALYAAKHAGRNCVRCAGERED